MVKANWDASVDLTLQRMGVGLIVRDGEGSVLAAMCTSVDFIIDPTVAEAMALWKAVSCCLDLGFSRIHLEGDALEVVQALKQTGSCWSRYGQIIEDTRSQLNGISGWCVSHTRREANEAAHILAKAAISQSLDCIWRGSYPDFLHAIVLAEQGSVY
jgi:ribonuclease HI